MTADNTENLADRIYRETNEGPPLNNGLMRLYEYALSLEFKIARERHINLRASEDWAEDHSSLQAICKKYFTAKKVEGDSNGVPGIMDLVDMLDAELARFQRERECVKDGDRNRVAEMIMAAQCSTCGFQGGPFTELAKFAFEAADKFLEVRNSIPTPDNTTP